MENLNYTLKKELVEEMLSKDEKIFSQETLEFKIFKYTSAFAVFAFSVQIILYVFGYFNGQGYLTYFQVVSMYVSLTGLLLLLFLYERLTSIIRRASNKKSVYVRFYICEMCDFRSFSNFKSSIHMMSSEGHSINEMVTLAKLGDFTNPGMITKIKSKILRKPYSLLANGEKDNDIVATNSCFRIRTNPPNEPMSNVSKVKLALSFLLILMFLVFPTIYFHVPIELSLITIGVIFPPLIALGIIAAIEEVKNEDNLRVLLLKINMETPQKDKAPEMSFKLYSCGNAYWERVKKVNLDEPIGTVDGPLFIVERLILNQFGELLGVNLDDMD